MQDAGYITSVVVQGKLSVYARPDWVSVRLFWSSLTHCDASVSEHLCRKHWWRVTHSRLSCLVCQDRHGINSATMAALHQARASVFGTASADHAATLCRFRHGTRRVRSTSHLSALVQLQRLRLLHLRAQTLRWPRQHRSWCVAHLGK